MNSLKTLITKLNPACRQALQEAVSLCLTRGHFNVELAHWIKCLHEHCQNEFSTINQQCGIESSILTQDIEKRLSQFKSGNDATPAISPRIIELINEAWLLASLNYQGSMISLPMLLYVLIENTTLQQIAFGISNQLEKLDVSTLKECITSAQASPDTSTPTQTANKQDVLNQYATNLNAQAKMGKIDVAIGRENEIRQVIDILARRRQNNAILTGEPGVGKTAIVEGLALLIEQGDVPDSLKEVTVYALDLGLLQAGASVKGEFENRLKALINEVKSAPKPIILFIDEAHTLIGSGGAAGQNDAANLLKPALARGELRSIAATTWDEYKKYFEKDPALTRRFQVVKVSEPDNDTAIRMLRSLTHSLEQHHQVTIDDEALKQAVILSDRYIHGRLLPDKAISVLDTACARVASKLTTTPPEIESIQKLIAQLKLEQVQYKKESKRGKNHKSALKTLAKRLGQLEKKLQHLTQQWQQEKVITNEIITLYADCEDNSTSNQNVTTLKQRHRQLTALQKDTPMISPTVNQAAIAEVISDWTGIPVGNMIQSEASKLLNLHTLMQRNVVGQDSALAIISQAIKSAGTHLASPDKPYGVFLLVGPSGVGKTETALSLAEHVYGSRHNITTINMSEFKEEHKVSMLAGSPPGYVGYGEGGVLTEAVRRQPYSLILLDEMEKAHPGIQDVFYQVFDKGMIKDGQGRDVNFKNTTIIMTSNACSDLISSLCENTDTPNLASLTTAIQDRLLKTFKPAFLGRVTIVPYIPLSTETLHEIIMLKLQKIQHRIAQEYRIKLSIEPCIVEYILQQCNQSHIGARQIDNIINRQITPLLSDYLLEHIAQKQKLQNICLIKIGTEITITPH